MLNLVDIHTYYGNIQALKGVSLEVKEGEIITLIGANGAGKTTTLMSVSGIVGNLIGGKAADHFGLKRVILIAYGLLSLLIPIFAWAGSAWVALALLVPIGFCVFASYSPTIVLGQYYLPTRIGFSSGITIGVAVAIGGGVAPILGKIADINGVWTSIAMLCFISPAMLLMSLTLPAAGPSAR